MRRVRRLRQSATRGLLLVILNGGWVLLAGMPAAAALFGVLGRFR